MKTTTVQDVLLRNFKNAKKIIEKINIAISITDDIINTDPALVAVDKFQYGRGTWRVWLLLNKHHFGNELTEYLQKKVCVYTHDEDRIFSIEDLREEIEPAVYDFADNWDFDKVEEE